MIILIAYLSYMLVFLLGAALIAFIIEKYISKIESRKIKPINIIIPCVIMIVLYILCKNPLSVLKGFGFSMLLLFASMQDIKKHEVDNWVHVLIALIALIGFNWDSTLSMLGGAAVAALPFFIASMVKKDSVGGADIKLMAASGFLLGIKNGLIALVIGLLLAVLITYVRSKLENNKIKINEAFPLIPYLSAGCFIAYFI